MAHVSEKRNECTEEKRERERKRLKALYDDAKNIELVDYEWSKRVVWKENIKHTAIAWKNLSTRFI